VNAELWRAVCALAETQHGLVSTRQLRDLGVGRKALERAVARGDLAWVRRRVLRVCGAPRSPFAAVAAACLAVGGETVASHRSAAALHGISGFLPDLAEITVFDRNPPRLSGVRAHRAGIIVADDISCARGIPVTTPARTLVDLASTITRTRLARALDEAERVGLARYGEVASCLDRLGTSGRMGAQHLRALLTDRVTVESQLEQAWLRRLRRAGLPPPDTQYQLVVDGAVLLLDFAWPVHHVGLEIDGWTPHRVRGAFDNDRRRDLLFRLAGWTVLRATSRTEPTLLIRALSEALSR
jgi:predicted transcriptional regulator of viral defense system